MQGDVEAREPCDLFMLIYPGCRQGDGLWGTTVEEERRSIEDQDPVRWCSLCAPQQPQETRNYHFPHFTAVEMKAQI